MYGNYNNRAGNGYGGNSRGGFGERNGYGGSGYGGGGGFGGGRGGGDLGSSLVTPDWEYELPNLIKFEKNFYMEAPSVSERSDDEVEQYRRQHRMNLFGKGIPKPITTFAEASFPTYVLEEVEALGFPAPTAIQAQGWPMALSGRDVVGVAQTGSGKVNFIT